MKAIRPFIFSLLILFSFNTIQAQKAEGILAVAGAVAGIAAVAIAQEQYIETLEGIATNFILENSPELNTFNLKVMDAGDNTRTFDPSNIKVQLFTVRPFDRNSGQYDTDNFMVLFMITSAGWWNSNGVVYDKVRFEILKRDTWNKLLGKYIELATQVELSGKDFLLKREEIGEEEATQNDTKIYNFTKKRNEYLRKTKDTVYFKQLELKPKEIGYNYRSNSRMYERTAIPIVNKLDNDSYLVEDFNETFKIIYNERSLGLYYKPLGELFQVKKNALNEINQVLN